MRRRRAAASFVGLVGFESDRRVARIRVGLLVFPQMFLAGALIPIQSSSGLLGLLAKLTPMNYSIDLARNISCAGKPEYALAVLHPLWLDLAVTVALFVAFTVIGTYFFVRGDRERSPRIDGSGPYCKCGARK